MPIVQVYRHWCGSGVRGNHPGTAQVNDLIIQSIVGIRTKILSRAGRFGPEFSRLSRLTLTKSHVFYHAPTDSGLYLSDCVSSTGYSAHCSRLRPRNRSQLNPI
jgi:hypothetical protein